MIKPNARKLSRLAGILAFCHAGALLAASAGGTAPISATVLASCSMGTLNNIVFANYDVFGSGALNASATVQFTCSKGTTFWSLVLIASDGAVGARTMPNGSISI